MSKPRWLYRKVVGNRVLMARMTRTGILVRIETKDGAGWTEWEMPKLLGMDLAADQANLQTKDEDLKP